MYMYAGRWEMRVIRGCKRGRNMAQFKTQLITGMVNLCVQIQRYIHTFAFLLLCNACKYIISGNYE